MKIETVHPLAPLYLSLFTLCILLTNLSNGQLSKTDSLRAALRSVKPDTVKVNLLNELGFYLSAAKPDTAILLSRQAAVLAEKTGSVTGETDALLKLGDYFRMKGSYDSSLLYNEQVIKICDNHMISKNRRIIINKGTAYFGIAVTNRERGNITDAIQYFNTASKIFQSQNDQWRVSNCYSGIGTTYEVVSNITAALENHLKSLKIKETLKDRKGIGVDYGNIGILYRNIKEYGKSIEYYNKAKNEFKNLNQPLGEAVSELNLGAVYFDNGELDTALKYYEKALAIFERIKASGNIPIAMSNIAGVYQKQKNFPKALEMHLRALDMKRALKAKRSVCVSLLNVGSLYSELNNLDSAEKYLLEAHMIAQTNNFLDDQKDISEELYKLYSVRSDYKKELFFYKQYVSLKDSLTTEENKDRFESQMLNFDFEKKRDSIKAEQEKQVAVAEADKKRAVAEADKKRLVAAAENKLQLTVAATEKQEILMETEKQIAVSEADKKRKIAESEQTRLAAQADAQKQKFIRNSIAGGAGIFLLSSLLVFLFYKRKRDAEQKQKETYLSLQVSETEMKALRSQMNPHFIFNALQSIQTFLLGHQSEEANAYLLKFAKLMRLVLENSQHSEVLLKEDMQALELYMQLESIRIRYPFTYQFHIDDSVDIENDCIPPLILQPFVENAIWHGLQYKPGPGHIDIFIKKTANALFATVEDNGVGRNMSKQTAQALPIKKESLGMKLTEERLKIHNEVKNVNARFNIIDLFTTDKKAAGTKVELSLPVAG